MHLMETNWKPAILLGIAAASLTWLLAILVVNLGPSLSLQTLSGVLFTFAGLAVTARAIHRRRSLLDTPIYLAFYAYVLFLGVAPLFAGLIDPLAVVVRDSYEPAIWALLLSWAGLGALVLGYRSGRGELNHYDNSRSQTEKRPHDDSSALLFGGVAWTLTGIGGIVAYLRSVGGLNYLLENAYGTRENPSVYAGFYNMLRPGLFLITAWALTGKRRSRALWALLLAYMCFDLFWFGPLGGSRSQIITLILTIAYMARYLRGRGVFPGVGFLRARWLIVAGVVLTVVWGGLRTQSFEDLITNNPTQLDLIAGMKVVAAKTLYAPFQGYLGVLNLVPTQVPYQWGRTLLDSVTVFIPRALWPSKSGSLGDWLAETVYGAGVSFNTVATWPGELYLNFGWLGLILGMYMTGTACAWMVRFRPMEHDGQGNVWRGLMAALWFPLPFIWIWGGSNTAVWHILFNVVPIWLVFKSAKLLRGQSYRRRFAPSVSQMS